MMEWLFPTLGIIAAASLSLTLFVHLFLHFKIRRPEEPSESLPSISILKPLKGVDDGLWENLKAMAEQDYDGDFEILLGAADADDPALDVAHRLRREYRDIPVRVFVCDDPIGMNPKVNNLAYMTRYARHAHFLISDSNVRPDPSYLRQTAAELEDEDVRMVSNVFAGDGENTMAALFENLHLNSFIASTLCGSDVLGFPVVVGKSMLFNREDLDTMGGWGAVCDVLAEDYLIGLKFDEAGYECRLSSHVVRTVNSDWGMDYFCNRHIRWSQIRRELAPGAFFAEQLINPVVWIVAAMFVGAPAMLETPSLFAVAIGGMLLKAFSDDLLNRRVRDKGIGWRGYLATPFKDLLVFFLWLVGSVRKTVNWRGNRFVLGEGSKLLPAEPTLREVASVTAVEES
ncbi:MAG: glycosyltransferase [Myxococcota bacterium]